MPSSEPRERELIEELWSLTRQLGTANGVSQALKKLKELGNKHGKSWTYTSFVLANHQALNGLVKLQHATKHAYSEQKVLEALKDLRQARTAFTDVATGEMRGGDLMSDRDLAGRLHIISWQIGVAHTVLRRHNVVVPDSVLGQDIKPLSTSERGKVMKALRDGELLENHLT